MRDGEKRLFVSVSFLMDDGLARRNRNLKESTSRARARGRSSTWRRFEERGLEVWVALSSAGLRQQLRQRNDEPREKRACRCYTGARPRGHRPTDHAGRSRLARDRGAVGADLGGGRRDLPHRGGRTVPFSGEARAVHQAPSHGVFAVGLVGRGRGVCPRNRTGVPRRTGVHRGRTDRLRADHGSSRKRADAGRASRDDTGRANVGGARFGDGHRAARQGRRGGGIGKRRGGRRDDRRGTPPVRDTTRRLRPGSVCRVRALPRGGWSFVSRHLLGARSR